MKTGHELDISLQYIRAWNSGRYFAEFTPIVVKLSLCVIKR